MFLSIDSTVKVNYTYITYVLHVYAVHILYQKSAWLIIELSVLYPIDEIYYLKMCYFGSDAGSNMQTD